MSKYETISTHEIRLGDVIHSDGMVLLVDQEPQVSKAHPVTDYGGACMWTAARVLNWDELVAEAESGHSIARMIVGFIKSDMSPSGHRSANGKAPYDVPRWTIQGNGLARWGREVKEDN